MVQLGVPDLRTTKTKRSTGGVATGTDMPTSGLSLVGFLDEQAALQHLRFVCKPADPTDAALRTLWQTAAAQLGPPTPNAGNPNIQPIPQAHAAYVNQVCQTPWLDSLLKTQWKGSEFRLVEIAPLLACVFRPK